MVHSPKDRSKNICLSALSLLGNYLFKSIVGEREGEGEFSREESHTLSRYAAAPAAIVKILLIFYRP